MTESPLQYRCDLFLDALPEMWPESISHHEIDLEAQQIGQMILGSNDFEHDGMIKPVTFAVALPPC